MILTALVLWYLKIFYRSPTALFFIGIYFLMLVILALFSLLQFGTVFGANDELKAAHKILFYGIRGFDEYSISGFVGNQGLFGWLAIAYKEVWSFFGVMNPYILKELAVVIHLSQLYFIYTIPATKKIKSYLYIFLVINPALVYYSFAGIRDVLIITATNLVVIYVMYGRRALPALLFSSIVAMSRIVNGIPLLVLSLAYVKNIFMRRVVIFIMLLSPFIAFFFLDDLVDFHRIILSQIEIFRGFQSSDGFLNTIRHSSTLFDDLLFLLSPLFIPFPESKLLTHSFAESIDGLYIVSSSLDWINARVFKVIGWIMLHSVLWSSILCFFFKECRQSITKKHMIVISILWISACTISWFDSNDARFIGFISALCIVFFDLLSNKKIFNQFVLSLIFGLSFLSVVYLIYNL